jgi:hypothetical protein
MPTTSGRSHEGWMALIPLTVLLVVVVAVLGGPEAVVDTIGSLAIDTIAYGRNWLKSF